MSAADKAREKAIAVLDHYFSADSCSAGEVVDALIAACAAQGAKELAAPKKRGKPVEPPGKNHCAGERCEKDCRAEDRCDCGCDRCGPWNDYRDDLEAYEAEQEKLAASISDWDKVRAAVDVDCLASPAEIVEAIRALRKRAEAAERELARLRC